MVPLSQVADVRAGVGRSRIERAALERQVTISAGVLPGFAMGDVAARTLLAIDSVGLPPGYRTVFRGDVQNLNETKGFVLEALLLAVVFIYLILASLFGSFVQPLAIMLALPLSFIGVALALLASRGTLNVYTMIGIIMLMGLVTKNGILLVDFANQEREAGRDRRQALLSAARTRPAADHHDHGGDDLRHGAAGPGARRRRRAAGADGAGGDRGAHHLDAAHAVRRAGGVHAARRPGGVGDGARAARRGARRAGTRRLAGGAGDRRLSPGARRRAAARGHVVRRAALHAERRPPRFCVRRRRHRRARHAARAPSRGAVRWCRRAVPSHRACSVRRNDVEWRPIRRFTLDCYLPNP
jgi:hypothetical protein